MQSNAEDKLLNLNFVILLIYCSIISFCLLYQFNIPLLYSDFIFNFAIISFIALLLYAYDLKKTSKWFAFVSILAINLQLDFMKLTGSYLNDLELDNIKEFNSLSFQLIKRALGWFVCLSGGATLIIFWLKDKTMAMSPKYLKRGALVFTLITLINVLSLPDLPLFHLIRKVSNHAWVITWSIDQNKKIEQKNLYSKDWIYKATNCVLPDLNGKNIIVFFVESLSAQVIDKFNNYSILTPNLSKLIRKSIYFDNYFNHTATTYRGLVGQLTSAYVMPGGIDNLIADDLVSVPQILHKNSYNAYFLSAHNLGYPLNTRLKTLEFDKVFYGNYSNKKSYATASDKELFQSLDDILYGEDLKDPYFFGVYNEGTHFGNDSPDLKFAKGDNPTLNVYHNFDHLLGEFLQKLMTSDKADSTAVIITADHAMMCSPEIQKNIGCTSDFVAKIPLLIYYKGVTPQIFDAQGKNSLNFAPTLLHMLKIKKADNYFLGCSLFDNKCKSEFLWTSAIGKEFYQTKGKVKKIKSDNQIAQKVLDFYHLSAGKPD